MKSRHRLFTLDEANALLPELELIFSKLHSKKQNHHRLHDELFMEELLREAGPHESAREEKSPSVVESQELLEKGAQALEKSLSEVEIEIRRLKTIGCIVRHLEKGWVDFFGEREGQYIFFSWRRGEPEIQFYRHLQASIEERFSL